MTRSLLLAAALASTAALPGFAADALRSALDGNAPPFAQPRMDGSVEGMTVDMTNEIAKRIGREISIEAMSFSALIPALQAGTFDMLSVPFTVSQERSDAFLLTEGIWAIDMAYLMRDDAADLATTADLDGKVMATNKGNVDDQWARENAGELGFTVESYGSLSDAAQAVKAGRADAALVNSVTGLSIAQKMGGLKLATMREDRGIYLTYPFPKGSEALRNEVEAAIECIKADGTAAAIYEKWLGTAPAEGSLDVTPQPGFGPEGFGNYDATEHAPSCG
ncbi:transporter substrate-binding domain-containing protein [Mangrovicoccus algicola]|uniref:Transporter substrate-binding domain-containing protein n=1 Tax=Mangrovicoccus algicola TaxID=2771008 RepID=A0A8J6YW03_9RHOB|nr:transporter substrate-binding domain-containing protein [Mangrovicoccus algicola]MBE3638777.1 transporter substrate-binding domain-containing protein [Mangrovicoccus algicola]